MLGWPDDMETTMRGQECSPEAAPAGGGSTLPPIPAGTAAGGRAGGAGAGRDPVGGRPGPGMGSRGLRWAAWGALVAGWIGGGTLSAQASLRDLETVVEFEFRGPTGGTWRARQSGVERYLPGWRRWVEATSPAGGRRAAWSDRVVVGVAHGVSLSDEVLGGVGLRHSRRVKDGLWILQAPDVWSAARAARRLADVPGVEVAAPVMRRALSLHGSYGPRPNDPYFPRQWHLENRDPQGRRIGPDTQPRGAWGVTRGEGVTVAICDDGFEVDHPDLADAATGPHYDFFLKEAVASTYGSHSTSVAGLVAARGNNGIGVAGVAPAAGLASWVIFGAFDEIVSEEGLMDMFEHRTDEVPVQNHSWGNASASLYPLGALEAAGLARALNEGRGGKGVVMVRSGGNQRETSSNANDDGYANDPRVVAVAAVRQDGRVASYSNPGSCLLVGAPSGDDGDGFQPTPNLFTTDRQGGRGYNTVRHTNDLADYAFETTGFTGTSAAAPQISGLVALALSVNSELTSRDVQQVLLHAARHFDLTDPAVQTNRAGYVVSHNQGFGIPDAGQVVRLARDWVPRPPLAEVTLTAEVRLPVRDDGLRASFTGADGAERSVSCRSALGAHPDDPTARLPLVFAGLATNALSMDLTGRAALIERGISFFRDKIDRAARAGASMVVLYNNVDGDQTIIPAGTDFSPIPAVMITENEGRALAARLAAGEVVRAQLRLDSARHVFTVTNALVCEHVGVRVRATHPRRGDLRITLVSPGGTRSVLQHLNLDSEPGPVDWTFWSVLHFGESSVGSWTVSFTDQSVGDIGSIQRVDLVVRGVPIDDTDADGLDDTWEREWFDGLAAGPADDPDGDGHPNAREYCLRTDPTRVDAPLAVAVALYDERSLRLSWPGHPASDYVLQAGAAPGAAMTESMRVSGTYPETEVVVPLDSTVNRFFRVEAVRR